MFEILLKITFAQFVSETILFIERKNKKYNSPRTGAKETNRR